MIPTEPFDFLEFPTLETKRLVLREPVTSDAADIFVFRSDPVVQRYNAEPMGNISEAVEFIKQHRAEYYDQGRILWAVALKSKDIVIGLVGFGEWNRYHHRAILGYDFARAYWGQGFASEAVREITCFGFERMHLNRIEAATIEDNHQSIRMLAKLGFVCEGVRRGYSYEEDGEYHGSAMYALVRSDITQNRAQIEAGSHQWDSRSGEKRIDYCG